MAGCHSNRSLSCMGLCKMMVMMILLFHRLQGSALKPQINHIRVSVCSLKITGRSNLKGNIQCKCKKISVLNFILFLVCYLPMQKVFRRKSVLSYLSGATHTVVIESLHTSAETMARLVALVLVARLHRVRRCTPSCKTFTTSRSTIYRGWNMPAGPVKFLYR